MAAAAPDTGTRIDEIADGIFHLCTPVPPSAFPGGFTVNQYLVLDDEPLLFHTGHRRLFPAVSAAAARLMPLERLRHVSFSHFEADECGALNLFLAAAPHALPLCGRVGARVSITDFADREPRPLADGEAVELGRHRVRWIDVPHLPHGWDCGCLMEEATGTLLCGDLFAEGGAEHPALTEGDILGPSEAFRASVDYYSHTRHARALIGRLAARGPTTLARMHGSAWRGDGAALLRALADRLDP
jgi:flavorubredoxin